MDKEKQKHNDRVCITCMVIGLLLIPVAIVVSCHSEIAGLLMMLALLVWAVWVAVKYQCGEPDSVHTG